MRTTNEPSDRPRRTGMARAGTVWLVAWLAVGGALAARAVTARPAAAGPAASATHRAKPIEQVRAGDRVWACDPATGRWAARAVVRPLAHAYDGDVITVRAAGAVIEATGNHPFWVAAGAGLPDRPEAHDVPAGERAALASGGDRSHGAAGRWVEARDLRVGDRVLLRDGRTTPVEGVAIRPAALPVYNLEVAGLHTYAVGAAGVLVHNKVGPDGPGSGAGLGSSNPKPPPNTRPPNMSPPGAGRQGALNEAKRNSGIPTSQSPDRVRPNTDRRGNPQPGRQYEYDVPARGGEKETRTIRDDAGGHNYGPNDPQNRGPHFNDEAGNHYDY